MGPKLIPIQTEDLSKYFDSISIVYDICNFIMHLGQWNRIVNESLELVKPKRGEKVLDVATGTGNLAIKFADLGCKVWGIDLSEGMLNKAIKKDVSKQIKFMQGDATKLPFDSKSFDICSISFGFHEMSNQIRDKCINEIIRVLKSNGRLLLIDYNFPENSLLKKIYLTFLRLWESEEVESLSKLNLHKYFKKFGLRITSEKKYLLGFNHAIELKPIN